MSIIDALVPAGKTPLTTAVEQAANVLDFREKPGVIVVLTDGEETCGRSPCELGKELHAEAAQLTINVIGLRVKGFSWTGEQTIVETKRLAEQNGGAYLPVETEDELASTFEKALGCPMISQHPTVVVPTSWLSISQGLSRIRLIGSYWRSRSTCVRCVDI
jgi:Ca-activated chloride channel family protein